MRVRPLVVLGALSSVAIAQGEPAADLSLTWPSPETVLVATPTPDNRQRNKRHHHSWVLQKRASTTEDAATTQDTATTTAEETTSATEESTTSATEATTAAATTTDAATTTSTTSSTTSTSSTTTSTTSSSTGSTTSTASSTSQSSTSASTTKPTSTTSTTSSTSSATSTTSAELREYNRRGTIAAIITFSILGSIFVGYACFHCFHENSKRRRIRAAAEKAANAGSSYSMVPLNEGGARSQSKVNFDRKSLMFATQSRADLEPLAYQGAGTQEFSQPMTRPSSMAASETLHQSPASGTPSQEHRGNFI